MYPLSMANEGETVVIQRITGRSDDDMILQVKGSRVALGSGMTKRIMV